jgi:hypothetical protein
MYNGRLCVLVELRSLALKLLQEGHPGVALMQEQARHLLFWPRITRDVHNFVQSFVPCARVASSRPREPMVPTAAPSGPGDQVAADFCSFHSHHYLIFYDFFSNFPFLFPVACETTQELLRCVYLVFSQTGLPTIFASDNRGPFASQEFQAFLTACGMKHRASSPRYPQSNSIAERAIQTLKRLLEKCPDEASLFRAILHLQNTRCPDLGASPSELFFSRSQRTPITPRPMQFQGTWAKQQAALTRRRNVQAKYYNRSTRICEHDLSGTRAILCDFVGPVVEEHVLWCPPLVLTTFVFLRGL